MDEKRTRDGAASTAGYATQEGKKHKKSDHASQLLRENDCAMDARCNNENIHFWSVGLEGDSTHLPHNLNGYKQSL
jgi:hypothetical protein